MPPKVLYFDLGNVLLSYSHGRMCRQMADVAGVSAEVVHDVLFGTAGSHTVQWQYEVGRLTTDAYYDYFCQQTGTRPDRGRLEHAACDIFAPMATMWDLVRGLAAAGHRLGIMSNINPLHWRFVTDGRFPVLAEIGQPGGLFSWAVLSFEVGSMKPDRGIYHAAIERSGAQASDIFFVDDRGENVDGATWAGLDAVPFVGVEALVDELEKRHIVGV